MGDCFGQAVENNYVCVSDWRSEGRFH
jgi:hypothetical protein